ncbi:LysE family translocator [Amycolatopsis sp. OK19-0408]|uniref:LysE family translocator n=1 Tax=Amycolatopsis iheyensis TaxID=2945988 RepID=A0A9X2SN84_9PSEU|nr:LysE family translocator [Amycolatopsis iheyensis]MCR6488692.1 LysE family translocator [Amycolatopsis iheyensis]
MAELLGPLLLFAVVMVVSPGTNNVLATTSGLRFGLRASLRLLAGLGLGVVSLVVLAALGLGFVVTAVPHTQTVLRALGTAYLLWLAVRILRSGRPGPAAARDARTFTTGLLVSWLNPKVWVLALSAVAGYSAIAADPLVLAAILGGVFAAVIVPNLLLWCSCGQLLAAKLTTDHHWRVANTVLAALLVVSVVPIWLE